MSVKTADPVEEKKSAPVEQPVAPAKPSESKPVAFKPVEMDRGDSAPLLYRNTTVEPDDFSDENTFQISISSEFPGKQRATAAHEKLGIAKEGEWFTEVLSHDPADIDLSWFNSGRAALLDEHKSGLHLGNLVKANVSKDKVLRAPAKFDVASKLSKTRSKQMRKHSRPNISCGYVHTRYLGSTKLEDGAVAHRFAFQPREASSVADPLDPTVGLNRAAEQCACYLCGKRVNRQDMKKDEDGALYCSQDCIDAVTDADEDDRATAGKSFRSKEDADKHFRANKESDFKFKRDAEDEVSFSDLAALVSAAADSDKRFKSKRENGDVFSAFFVSDIVLDKDESTWYATLFNWYDGVYWKVEFELEGDKVTLGEAQQVIPVTKYEPVEEGRSMRSAKPTSAALTVDSPKLSNADNTATTVLTNKVMPKTIAELEAESPELISTVRATHEKTVRATVETEAKNNAAKLTERNKEIHDRADAAVKTYGGRVNGKPNEVFYCGERIRKIESDLCARDAGHDGAELRREFGRELDLITQGSREAKNPLEASNLPSEVASRCSLGNLLRSAMRNSDKWVGTGPFRPTDGAELEADQEMRKIAREFPGGEDNLPPGIQLPVNMPTAIRSKTPMAKLQRDTLAGDFVTAGAFIAPDYRFPFIELLRNLPVMGRAGMTMLTGLQGGSLVLPRQEAATTAQWVAEGAQLSQYDQVLGQIRLNPHRIGSSQNYGRLALIQAPQIEEMIWADHMAQIALGIDAGILNGTGGGEQPLGILNSTGISSVAFGGSAALAYKFCVAMKTAVRKANIYEDGTFLTTSASRGTLESTAKLFTGATVVVGDPIWTDNETVAGRPAFDSQQVPSDIMVYVVGRHVIFAQWGGLAVVLDQISRADRDEYRLSLNTYVDGGLRHAQAVCRTADSLAVLA